MQDEQLLRYSRHILLPGLDVDGQERLLAASVLIVGLGGLGSPVALYLAAAGVGRLTLADDDMVELSNLQRQIAHRSEDIGSSKVASARDACLALNPDTVITTIDQRLEGAALASVVAAVDLVVDCSDNFATRFALNAACVEAAKPLVSGAAIRSEGQLSVFDSRQDDSPCYRCLYSPDDDGQQLNCSEAGVLAPVVGVIGSMQALETVKLLSGFGEPLTGRLLLLDGATMDIRTLKLAKDPACPVCGGQEKTPCR
ncbi:MAG TPA: molybdopterin-synthase adenylyltransferase MoeB [Spongiibacteraceae bacterium]|nr:molybdopterin-synthase adenylyltransferase MoeB [Spongiibacteraceae bacterium]HCS29293.1 molybdopterin-synthase adenylyltransferase MoeB [Spongiibacteraceae bacterium]|tara:strand:+ start:144 stop:911 length:768 start_codon:yes stop_codon:yes gene_type:complete